MSASPTATRRGLRWRTRREDVVSPRGAPTRRDVDALYTALAPAYDVLRTGWSLTVSRRIEAIVDRWILRSVVPSPSVLDLGCGTGANLDRLLHLDRKPRTYLGVDASADMLRVASARFRNLSFVAFEHADVRDVDERLGPFDLVISTYALSHLERPRAAIERGLRLLTPRGRAIFAFIGGAGPGLRSLLRPVEGALAFRYIPAGTYEGLQGVEESATSPFGLLTALLFSAASPGGAEGR